MSTAKLQGVDGTGDALGRVAVDDELELKRRDDQASMRDSHPSQLRRVDWAALANPVVLQSAVALVIAVAVLTWPHRSDQIMARLIGLGLVNFGAATAISWVREPREWPPMARAALRLFAGLGLAISPTKSAVVLGAVVGAVVIAEGVITLGRFIVERDGDHKVGLVSSAFAELSVGTLLVTLPTKFLSTIMMSAALITVGGSLIAIMTALSARTPAGDRSESVFELLGRWVRTVPQSEESRRELAGRLFFEGPQLTSQESRFLIQMAFATVIAALGVITDSTAVVIGAMLVAPLMTPLMGISLSIVMGWRRRLSECVFIAFVGVALAVLIGFLIGLVAPTIIDTSTNTQILTRVSPTMLDLFIAIAAGSAGAYGLARTEASGSLTGVAVAIALVPPLAVSGICASQGDWSGSLGAFVLFATNGLAIIVFGGVTFVATGVAPLAHLRAGQHRVRTAVVAVAAMSAVVLGLLIYNGSRTTSQLFERQGIERAVDEWSKDLPLHSVTGLQISDDAVVVSIAGPQGTRPDVQRLAAMISDSVDGHVTVDVRQVSQDRWIATADA